MSTALLERYLAAAGRISRLAVGDGATAPVVETYRVPIELFQDERESEDLPFGSRGGIAIRHHFPVDAEYAIRIRLQRDPVEELFPRLSEPEDLEVRLDGALLNRFSVGKDAFSSEGKFLERKQYADASPTSYEVSADRDLEVRFVAKAGRRIIGVAFVQKRSAIEGFLPEHRPSVCHPTWLCSGRSRADVELGVDSVDVGGPYNPQGPGDTPSRRRLFVCRPEGIQDEESCAKKILATVARRAVRRPVVDSDVETLLGFYRVGRAAGTFEGGIQKALERLLVDPEFLFRIERDPQDVAPGAAYRLTDLELASRLSFFLWSSIPDEELLQVAQRGELKEFEILERQVRRMLADERASALVTNFAAQWLHLRNMRAVRPDVYAFPEFNENLRRAFQQETMLFLESQLRDDRPITELLTATYTFVNERLAQHYGIPGIYGSHFRRITISDDRRAGLLGHGSILTVTSHAHRTSPVLRGKWLLENVLGAPPPAPPANVPALPENRERRGVATSVRERLEEHRRNPGCITCHAPMDPLGFALENLDGIGKWRDSDAGKAVDARGTLPDGKTFDGPNDLRLGLLDRPEDFVRTVTEKLLVYALGRGLESYDNPAIRQILREARFEDYRWSAIILGVVRSNPFQMRRAHEQNSSLPSKGQEQR
jgi:hypothetical protein